MKWITHLSNAATLPLALEEVTVALQKDLDGQTADLCMVFVSSDFMSGYETVNAYLQKRLSPRLLLGCSGGGVVGGGLEVEHHPAIAVTVAVLPNVGLTPFRVADTTLPGLDVSPREWHKLMGVPPAELPQFIILADPFSIRTENLLMGLDFAYPKAVKVGGLASGAAQPGENALYLNSVCYRSGAVGVALTGNIALDAVVAQGCRPIGKVLRVTKCDRNILLELDGKAPLEVLRELFSTLDTRDQSLLQNALFLGLVMDPLKSHFTQGDFLVRNIAGLDPEKGYLAVGALLRPGQLVKFHLRDAQTSSDDLEQILTTYRARATREPVAGALLFSCLGRGEFLYGRRNHDSDVLQQKLGPIPMAGFFCNGEIGPVSGTTYLHGYTSCFALFRPLYVSSAPEAFSNAAGAYRMPHPPAL